MQVSELISHNNAGRFTRGLGHGWRYFRLADGFSLVNDSYGTRVGLSIHVDITGEADSQVKVHRIYGDKDSELIFEGMLIETENICLSRLHFGLHRHLKLSFGY